MTTTTKTPAKPTLVNLVLQKNHTHEGNRYGEGSVLTVDTTTAAWLVDQNIAVAELAVETSANKK